MGRSRCLVALVALVWALMCALPDIGAGAAKDKGKAPMKVVDSDSEDDEDAQLKWAIELSIHEQRGPPRGVYPGECSNAAAQRSGRGHSRSRGRNPKTSKRGRYTSETCPAPAIDLTGDDGDSSHVQGQPAIDLTGDDGDSSHVQGQRGQDMDTGADGGGGGGGGGGHMTATQFADEGRARFPDYDPEVHEDALRMHRASLASGGRIPPPVDSEPEWVPSVRRDVTPIFSLIRRAVPPDMILEWMRWLASHPEILRWKRPFPDGTPGIVYNILNGNDLGRALDVARHDAEHGVPGAEEAFHVYELMRIVSQRLGGTGLAILLFYHPAAIHAPHRDGCPRAANAVIGPFARNVVRNSNPVDYGRRVNFRAVGNDGSVLTSAMGTGTSGGPTAHGRYPYDWSGPFHVQHDVPAQDVVNGVLLQDFDGGVAMDTVANIYALAAAAAEAGIPSREYADEPAPPALPWDIFPMDYIRRCEFSEMNEARGLFGTRLLAAMWERVHAGVASPEDWDIANRIIAGGREVARRWGAVLAFEAGEGPQPSEEDVNFVEKARLDLARGRAIMHTYRAAAAAAVARLVLDPRFGALMAQARATTDAARTAHAARAVATVFADAMRSPDDAQATESQRELVGLLENAHGGRAGLETALPLEAARAVADEARGHGNVGRIGSGSSMKCNAATVQTLFTALPIGKYYTAREAADLAGWPKVQNGVFTRLVLSGFLELDPNPPGRQARYRRRL